MGSINKKGEGDAEIIRTIKMSTQSISIHEDRVAIRIESGKTVQFAVWNLTPDNHDDCIAQFKLAFSICGSFDRIERHMKINGYDATLEDIYE